MPFGVLFGCVAFGVLVGLVVLFERLLKGLAGLFGVIADFFISEMFNDYNLQN